jgi:hypothetical protein
MSALPDTPPAARILPADPALNRSREEVAFQAVGRAAETIRLSGAKLIAAFETYQIHLDRGDERERVAASEEPGGWPLRDEA